MNSTEIVQKIRRARSDEAIIYHIKNLFSLMREGDKYSYVVANEFCNRLFVLKTKDGTLPKKYALNLILEFVIDRQKK